MLKQFQRIGIMCLLFAGLAGVSMRLGYPWLAVVFGVTSIQAIILTSALLIYSELQKIKQMLSDPLQSLVNDASGEVEPIASKKTFVVHPPAQPGGEAAGSQEEKRVPSQAFRAQGV